MIYLVPTNALNIIINAPNGENWTFGQSHTIDFNVLNAGTQSDSNTSIIAKIYYSKVQGARENLIVGKYPLFETINPDANSQSWVYGASGQQHYSYDTTQKIDGAGSAKFGIWASDNPAVYYSTFVKYTDMNLFDINKNGGKISFYMRTDCVFCLGADPLTFLLEEPDGTDIASESSMAAKMPDANGVWKAISIDLNTMSSTQTFATKKIGRISLTFATDNPVLEDANFWIDGIRFYQNKNCAGSPNFDGNQEKNTNCDYNWTLPVTGDLNFVDINISNGTTTAQDSGCINGACTNVPTIKYASYDVNQGFSTAPITNGKIYLQCTDTEPGLINYVVTVNDVNISNTNDSNNTLKTIDYNFSYGLNELEYYCINIPGFQDTESTSFNVYTTKFILIDEETGGNFSVVGKEDVNSLYAFSADRNVWLDLNTLTPMEFYYTAQDQNFITVEISYNDSLKQKSIKYLNSSLLGDSVRVCAVHFQQFYQQIFVSYSELPVWLTNKFANCYIVADYTKFAYKNALSVQGTTINKPYLLETNINGVKTILSNQDGALASEINLDTLIFQKETTQIQVTGNYLSFGKYFDAVTEEYDQNILQISYENTANDNNSTKFEIYKGTNLLETYTETSSPDKFIYDWNYASYNLDSNDILKLVLTIKKDNGTTVETTNYFSVSANYSANSFFSEWLGIILAFLVILFGLTVVGTRFALGWFGVLVCITALAILAVTPAYWFVTLATAIVAIIGVFIIIVYKNENSVVQ